MLDVGPEPPDLEQFDHDEDEWKDPFKRRMAMLMVGVTLFGSVVAFAEALSSNREDRAAREVQRQAVRVLGEKSEADNAFLFEYDVYTRARLLDRRRIDAHRGRRADEARRLAEVKAAVGNLTALVADQRYADDRRRLFSGIREADLLTKAYFAELARTAHTETRDDWSHKASAYIAILTVLAVSLFLFGLSLSAASSVRLVLLVPGLAIVLACVAWFTAVGLRPVDQFSRRAIEAVAEGDRLFYRAPFELDEATARHDLRKSIEAYSQAIRLEPRFAQAYARRADARVIEGSPQSPLETFGGFSTTSPVNLRAALRDAQQAFRLGGSDDVEVVASLASKYFLAGRHAEAVRLNRRGAELNESLPGPWFNIAVNQVALGNANDAEEAFRTAFKKVRASAYPQVSFAVSRSDLEVIRKLRPARASLVERFRGLLASEELRLLVPSVPDTDPTNLIRLIEELPDESAATIDLFQVEGPDVSAQFNYQHIPKSTPLIALVSVRTDATKPWAYRPQAVAMGTVNEKDAGAGFVRARVGDCPSPGEYRLELYSGERLLAAREASFDADDSGQMIPHSDAVVGATLCRPHAWTFERSDDGMTVGTPDGSATFTVRSFFVDIPVVGDRRAIEDEIIDSAAEGRVPYKRGDFLIGGGNGRVGYFDLGSGHVAVAAFLGSDNVVRMVLSTSPSSRFDVTNPVLFTLRFTELPEDDRVVNLLPQLITE